MTAPIGHVMILASAGSGKTYALTNRFVRLLALGAKPERIVALTFTRKAAGEFFDEILNKLARAAADSAYAEQLAREIGVQESGARAASRFLALLRLVVDAMHRLRLGTLDGFFARIARNFPLELGLAGEFEVLQEHAAHAERTRVLRRMFQRSGELAAAQREFIEAFKRATFGADEKRLGAQLEAFLDRHQEIFLTAPGADGWGNPDRIWPQGMPWAGAGGRREKAAAALRAALAQAELSDKQRARWEAFFDEFTTWSAGAPMGGALEYLFTNALKGWPELAEIMVERKKHPLSPEARAALRDVLLAIVELEFSRRLEMTRGIHAVLAGYEAVYHDAVRRAGKLTFGDVQRLLQPGKGAPILASGESLAAGEERRLLIDYRLDGEIDHWLLDEFQDTSFGQWSVLQNLIDEVVQDPTGARSFFYVGDVKQAIFAWREGDPRLFREIFHRYNAARPGTIAEEYLVSSWRSGPPVIETVNRVFGDAGVMRTLFPGPAAEAWAAEWRAHESARPQLGGHAALLQAEDEAARFAVALAVLHEIDPLGRGLSCAVLVQNNATATRLADYLRQHGGLPAMAESDLHVCIDNPLGAALLALAKAAAHPGDTLAQQHVRMTPLGPILAAEGLEVPESLTRAVLGRIHAEGFERTMARWIRRLEPVLAPGDFFTRERARQFTAAARLFDETGSREVAEFIAFMERHTVRESEAAAVIRVMTIHKSKGLGFDVVVLPDLEGIRLDCRREGLAVQKSAAREVEWVLDLPSKVFHANDDVLAAHIRAAEADACYENLSLLYVAMTRAKRGMYLVAKPPGTSTSRNFPKLLADTLGEEAQPVRVGSREFAGSFSVGDPNWFSGIVAQAGSEGGPASVEVPRVASGAALVHRVPARKPSGAKAAEVAGAHLFSLQRGGAADFGTAVHALLAEVEWVEGATVEQHAGAWRAREVPPETIEEALGCLREPALREIWTRPESGGRVDVWRERPFEVVLEGAWITGVFDRVVVVRGSSGAVERVTVIDFKTDWSAEKGGLHGLVEKHTGQLNVYRRVAAVLTGLDPKKVNCVLVFTRLRRAAVVPQPQVSA
ncbi:MAG TPA: UvrD-helicase domain-containing protein [Opitutus sp.]|nr:UvrD-helicase domain-containing protein [Opitutus sp.]